MKTVHLKRLEYRFLAGQYATRPKGYINRDSQEQRQGVQRIKIRLVRREEAAEALRVLDRAVDRANEDAHGGEHERAREGAPVRVPLFARERVLVPYGRRVLTDPVEEDGIDDREDEERH